VEKHIVAYQENVGAICASDYKGIRNYDIGEDKAVVERVAVEEYRYGGHRKSETAASLRAKGGNNGGGSESMVIENRYAA